MLARPCLAVLAALALAAPAAAQNVTADAAQIAGVLQQAGYRAEITGEPGEQSVLTGTSGLQFTIQLYGCDEGGAACRTVMFYAWFDQEPPSLEAMNSFAREWRWGRVYIDEEGDATIAMDIDLEDGGMSPALFVDNIEYWDVVLNQFATFISTGEVPSP